MLHLFLLLILIFFVMPLAVFLTTCLFAAFLQPFWSLWKSLRSLSIDDLRDQIARARGTWIQHR